MCGRFTWGVDSSRMEDEFGISHVVDTFKPNYNAAPTQKVPIVTMNGERTLQAARWGLIPGWARDEKIGYKMINARAESVTEKPSYRAAFKHKRCLVVADGFYEWKKSAAGKIPFYIRVKDRDLFGFAGLWEEWKDPKGEKIISCTIITTEANKFMQKIHDRMPVILQKGAEQDWLDTKMQGTDILLKLLKPYPTDQMSAIEVSTFVNSPKNNSIECISEVRHSGTTSKQTNL